MIDEYYFQNCLPGISYSSNKSGPKSKRKKNQLRFFESGDIINNIKFNFRMKFSNKKKTYQGYIMKVDQHFMEHYKNLTDIGSIKNNRTATLNWHLKNNKENISWPEITPYNYRSTLHDVISKFKNKSGHYVLIVGSCQEGMYENVKNKSIIYKKYDLIKEKLACFQTLSKQIKNDINNNIHRLHNFSSTIKKKQNCYIELISKLKKKIYESRNISNKSTFQSLYDNLIKIYKNNELFKLDDLVSIIENLDNLTNSQIEHYYNNNNNGENAETKRQSRINNSQNNTILPNWFNE